MNPTATNLTSKSAPASLTATSAPPPSPAYLAEMAARRAGLAAELAKILPAGGGPFVWEIGCGHGHFLAAYAAAYRERLCVGVDQDIDRIRRAARKQARANLPNLHFVRGEATLFLAALPPGATLAAVYVLFPDPWPKRRHHKNRLLQADFFAALAARAGEGTPFFFRTDHEPYFREVEDLLKSHPDWRLAPPAPWQFEEPTIFQQKAERHHSLLALRR